jgi:hypothetical protein
MNVITLILAKHKHKLWSPKKTGSAVKSNQIHYAIFNAFPHPIHKTTHYTFKNVVAFSELNGS